MHPLYTREEFLNLELDKEVKELSHLVVTIAEDTFINLTYDFQFLSQHSRFVVILRFLDVSVEVDIGILSMLKLSDELKKQEIKSLFKSASRDMGEELFFGD